MPTAEDDSITVASQATETHQKSVPPPSRNGRWSGYSHLLVARLKELKREPEVIFWVFVFPLLLALGLGIAFRNKPADAAPVAIVNGPEAQHVLAMLEHSSAVRPMVLDQQQALQGFRVGKFDVVI